MAGVIAAVLVLVLDLAFLFRSGNEDNDEDERADARSWLQATVRAG